MSLGIVGSNYSLLPGCAACPMLVETRLSLAEPYVSSWPRKILACHGITIAICSTTLVGVLLSPFTRRVWMVGRYVVSAAALPGANQSIHRGSLSAFRPNRRLVIPHLGVSQYFPWSGACCWGFLFRSSYNYLGLVWPKKGLSQHLGSSVSFLIIAPRFPFPYNQQHRRWQLVVVYQQLHSPRIVSFPAASLRHLQRVVSTRVRGPP